MLPLDLAAAPRLRPSRPRRRHQGLAEGDSPLRGGVGQASRAAPPPEEQTKGEKLFAELSAAVEEVPRRERKSCEWIRGGTWRLVDQRNALRKQDWLSMVEGRRLGRRIRASFQSNHDYRALQAGHTIMANLAEDKVKAAWGHLRA